MYDYVQVNTVDLMYIWSSGEGVLGRLEDIIDNEALRRRQLIDILKEKGRPTEELLKHLFKQPIILSSQDFLKMGFIDAIIPTGISPPPLASSPPFSSVKNKNKNKDKDTSKEEKSKRSKKADKGDKGDKGEKGEKGNMGKTGKKVSL